MVTDRQTDRHTDTHTDRQTRTALRDTMVLFAEDRKCAFGAIIAIQAYEYQ